MTEIKLQSEYPDLDKYENEFGDIFYYKKDMDIWHNPYGPAIIWVDGHKEYWLNNKRHRLDGPAMMWLNGNGSYCINDEYLTKEEFEMHPERLKYLGKEHLICLL